MVRERKLASCQELFLIFRFWLVFLEGEELGEPIKGDEREKVAGVGTRGGVEGRQRQRVRGLRLAPRYPRTCAQYVLSVGTETSKGAAEVHLKKRSGRFEIRGKRKGGAVVWVVGRGLRVRSASGCFTPRTICSGDMLAICCCANASISGVIIEGSMLLAAF